MNHHEHYLDELHKLDKLEQNYWQRWDACSQDDARNERYLRGLRWCMTHRLKLLAKLQQLEKAAQEQLPPPPLDGPPATGPAVSWGDYRPQPLVPKEKGVGAGDPTRRWEPPGRP